MTWGRQREEPGLRDAKFSIEKRSHGERLFRVPVRYSARGRAFA